MYQLFGTMSLQNSIFQISTDRDKNIQLRGSCMTGNFVSKFNTIISQNKEIFSQIEIDLRKKYNNFCLKMIQPAIKGTDLIYVFNFMQQMGSFAIGAEVIGSKSFLGLTLAGRHENTDSISTISIHQFNSLNFSYFRKINRLLNAGFNISYSKSYPLCYGIGLMMKSRKCEIKTCLNNEKKILFSYEDKLTEGLSISANCEFSKNTLDYGYGMGYEF